MKVLAITQARYGSTRLPAKILKEVNGITLLETHLKRILQSKLINKLMVATTDEEGAHYIVDIAKKVGVDYYQGSVDEVLDRFYQTALPEKPDYVVRVTSDCPLIDPAIIDATIQTALEKNVDYCTNVYPPTFPDGMDCEVIKFSVLKQAWEEATLKSDREHVTEFIGKNSPAEGGSRYTYANFAGKEDNSDLRITVDTPEDFELVKVLLQEIGPNATCEDYVSYLRNHKKVIEINNMYERNEGYQKSLLND